MPFGLKGVPSIFQRLMDMVLAPCHHFTATYLDDVIYSETRKEDLDHLHHILQQLDLQPNPPSGVAGAPGPPEEKWQRLKSLKKSYRQCRTTLFLQRNCLDQEPRRFIYVKRATIMNLIFWSGLLPHHKNMLLLDLGCGFVPEIP